MSPGAIGATVNPIRATPSRRRSKLRPLTSDQILRHHASAGQNARGNNQFQHGRLFGSESSGYIDVNPVRMIAAYLMLDGVTVQSEPNAIDDPLRVIVN